MTTRVSENCSSESDYRAGDNMKRCPECRRSYTDETLNFCLDDGAALLDGPGSLEPPTSVLPFGGDEALTRQQLTQTGETAILTSGSKREKPERSSGKVLAVLVGLGLAAAAIGYGGYKLYSNALPVAPVRSSLALNTQRLTGVF